MIKILQRAPRVVVWAAYACFACRIFVPAGYMPAPLSGGIPFILCHGGVEGRLLSAMMVAKAHQQGADAHHAMGHEQHAAAAMAAGGHHDSGHDDHDQGSHAVWTHCPVGAMFSSFAVASSMPALALVHGPADTPENFLKTLVETVHVRRQPIRAPPSSSTV